MWNIFKSNYTINNSTSIQFNLTFLRRNQLTQFDSTIDDQKFIVDNYDGFFGLNYRKLFFGINIKLHNIDSPSIQGVDELNNLTDVFKGYGGIFLIPYLSIKLIDKNNLSILYTHSYDDANLELPQFLPQLMSGALYLRKNDLSISKAANHFSYYF